MSKWGNIYKGLRIGLAVAAAMNGKKVGNKKIWIKEVPDVIDIVDTIEVIVQATKAQPPQPPTSPATN